MNGKSFTDPVASLRPFSHHLSTFSKNTVPSFLHLIIHSSSEQAKLWSCSNNKFTDDQDWHFPSTPGKARTDMNPIESQASEFLSQRRIAVAGISRSGKDAGNAIYKKLKETGHEVFGVNPNAKEIDGEPCYPDLASIPGGVDGVVAVTTPSVTEKIVQECVTLGVHHVWMHRSFGNSVSVSGIETAQKNGIKVIAGGCPMMFQDPVDIGHKCMKWWVHFRGSIKAT